MKILKKYHKQTWSRKQIKTFKSLNKTYELGLDVRSTRDCLKISIFETGLKNKQMIETSYDTVRNANIDMWDNLQFNEKNFIIQCDTAGMKSKLKKFKVNDTQIHIPFFSELLNGLYDRETAILELPQYFKLYQDFNKKIGDVEAYGLEPYRVQMSCAQYICGNDTTLILHESSTHRFFKLTRESCDTYPYSMKVDLSVEQLKELAARLLEDESYFVDMLMEQALIHKRAIKKIQKRIAKEKK